MRKYTIGLLLIILSNTIGCQEKTKKYNDNFKSIDKEKKMDHLIIDEQRVKERLQEYESNSLLPDEEQKDIEMDEDDIKLAIPIIATGLRNNGFKSISDAEFKEKLRIIFGIDLDKKCYNILDHKDFFTYSLENCKFFDKPNDCIENIRLLEYFDKNIYFIKKNNYMTSLPMLWTITRLENNKIKIKIPQNIIYRNQYLFNDDKSKFVWLTHNDENFMESLVKTFGYIEDKKLLNWVMEKNYDKAGDFIKNYVFVRDCQGRLEVREDILKYIEETTNDQERHYAMQLLYLGGDRDKWKDWSDEEYYKITAYMANTFDYLAEKYTYVGLQSSTKWTILEGIHYGMYMNNVRGIKIDENVMSREEWEKMLKIFKDNNYYNLPYLKEAVERSIERTTEK